MMTWEKRRIQYVVTTDTIQKNPSSFGDTEVVHYSIPAIQETGGPVIQRASQIESNKLLLKGNEILISKLNPHKNCVARVSQHIQPILCSTEFVPLTPNKYLITNLQVL